MFRFARCVVSALASLLLVWPYSAVFGANLSDEAVREAYFLGQRNDEKTARFLETYRRRFPMPQSGLYVSEIELFTPYAETVDLSRQRTFGYSAQQAAQAYRDRGDVFRLRVRVFFTDTYSLRTYAQTATQKDGRKTKHYDGDDVAADNAEVVVLTPDGQRLAAEFDLAKLP